jgi:hypothetical protein
MKMSQFKNFPQTILLGIFCMVAVFSCKNDEDSPVIGNKNFIFLEHWKNTRGELIEGDYTGGPTIDFPGYRFDKTTQILEGEADFKMSKSLIMILGQGASLSGVAGGGAASGLYGIYDLPFKDGNLMVEEIMADGTIRIQYKDSLITLRSKEEWIEKTEELVTQNNNGKIAKANFITTEKFINHGILEKSKTDLKVND